MRRVRDQNEAYPKEGERKGGEVSDAVLVGLVETREADVS